MTSQGILAANPEAVKLLRPHPPRGGSVDVGRFSWGPGCWEGVSDDIMMQESAGWLTERFSVP